MQLYAIVPVNSPDPGRPDNSLPRPGRPVDPGYGMPEGGRPDQGLPPSAGRPDNSLPGYGRPVDPGYGRPDIGWGHPDNSLPGGRPGNHPSNPIYRPDISIENPIVIPPSGEIDNSLPGGAGTPDNSLPPSAGNKPVEPAVPPQVTQPIQITGFIIAYVPQLGGWVMISAGGINKPATPKK